MTYASAAPSSNPNPNRGVAAAAHEQQVADAGPKNGAAEWDERYAGAEQLWSGQPNGVLVAEVAQLTPGRALEVGCGEGAARVRTRR
ncbi:MAG: hypothetical protein QOI75_1349 [Pseudonocardiales bacterium]|nr:hypothetical protein [Pseudonocardiales bacterium]